MKSVLLCLLFAPLTASAATLEEQAFSVRYPAAFSNDRMGMLSAGSFSIKPQGFTSLELNVGVSNTLKKFETKYEKTDDDFPGRVIVWLNYRF